MLIVAYKLQKGIHKIKRIVTTPDPAKIKRINFAVTYRCNSQCKACSIWKKYHNESTLANQELSLEQIKGLFNQGKYFNNLDEINLTGGEPFLRRDFRDIYRYLRCRFPRTTIIISTNGLQLKDNWIKNRKDIFWTTLIFSMDGLQEINDSIRGVKGSYQLVIKAIDYYKGLFPSLKMGISFTMLPENYQELRKVYDLSRERKLSFTTRFVCNSETYYGNSGINVKWTDEMLNKVEMDVKSIIKEIARSRNSLNRLLNPDLFFLSQMVNYQRQRKRLFRCYSGTFIRAFFRMSLLGILLKNHSKNCGFSTKRSKKGFLLHGMNAIAGLNVKLYLHCKEVYFIDHLSDNQAVSLLFHAQIK
jgi:MoaA/NifB/PqqE/SkfB family radical SAM enzyme